MRLFIILNNQNKLYFLENQLFENENFDRLIFLGIFWFRIGILRLKNIFIKSDSKDKRRVSIFKLQLKIKNEKWDEMWFLVEKWMETSEQVSKRERHLFRFFLK